MDGRGCLVGSSCIPLARFILVCDADFVSVVFTALLNTLLHMHLWVCSPRFLTCYNCAMTLPGTEGCGNPGTPLFHVLRWAMCPLPASFLLLSNFPARAETPLGGPRIDWPFAVMGWVPQKRLASASSQRPAMLPTTLSADCSHPGWISLKIDMET